MTDDELKRLLEASAAETRRHVDSAVERVEKRVDDTAGEMRSAVERVEKRVDDTAAEMRTAVERVEKRVDDTAAEMRTAVERVEKRVNDTAAEMRRHFDIAKHDLFEGHDAHRNTFDLFSPSQNSGTGTRSDELTQDVPVRQTRHRVSSRNCCGVTGGELGAADSLPGEVVFAPARSDRRS